MINKTLLYIIATIVIIAVAIMSVYSTRDNTKSLNALLLPDFIDDISSIDKIEIKNPTNSVVLLKNDNIWFVEKPNKFLANEKKITSVLYDISNLYIIDKKTKNPDKYHHLGLRDITDSQSKATLFVLYKNGKEFKSILSGKKDFLRNGATSYARLDSKPQSFLLKGIVDASTLEEDYREKAIRIFNTSDLNSIVFLAENKTLDKNSSNQWVSKNAKINQFKIQDLLSSISHLEIKEAIKQISSDKKTAILSLHTNNGKTTISTIKKDKKLFIHIGGSNDARVKKLFDNWYVSNSTTDNIAKTSFSGVLEK